MGLKLLYRITFFSALFYLTSCNTDTELSDGEKKIDRSKLKDWSDLTHGKLAKPNYDAAFNQSKINSLEIIIGRAYWDSIKLDMKTRSNLTFGGGGIGGGVPGPGGVPDLIPGDPRWVECTVINNGKSWERVGFRLKGNSSLSGSWRTGTYKLPFKLQFDEYEDRYKETTDQRFFGFKEFSMSPAYQDFSLMRDKLVSDIFRTGGIPAANTAFYKVSIDFGEGLKYCGVYTMVEVIHDTMVKDQWGEEKGNIYKPESNFVTYNQPAFEKKNNTAIPNYGDVISIFSTLHAVNRKTNPDVWRANLEANFDVNHFLKYLAINNTIVNWDVYGVIAHNYYLYTPTVTKKVTWIPWDFNLALTSNTGGGFGRGLSFSMSEVSASQWPLIKFLIEDPVYYEQYRAHVKKFINEQMTPDKMNAIIDNYSNMIRPFAIQEVKPYSYLNSSQSDFEKAVTSLKTHFQTRYNAALDFVK
jgi:spore coat protein H